jgi:L-asparaginase/Glu-tRNA(Gln) amidotransferase subunit D
MPRTKLLILYTGGTIGMGYETPGDSQSPLIPQGWDFLQETMPAIVASRLFYKGKGYRFQLFILSKSNR